MAKYNDFKRLKSAKTKDELENKFLVITLTFIAVLLLVFMIYLSGGIINFIEKVF
ncbi:hypothetical protein [Faecalibacter bovis]|uniref:Uncharacterized protein n=1 Tax=Faecalibacter bovis TaxID=2898187 RepID=A0ABX7XCM3_9FLAO|nr:hypothetical protein [Faecalibacter bovis]QTV05658.1 hypothetical protein J9309_12945 [Faecalibacter bovis]